MPFFKPDNGYIKYDRTCMHCMLEFIDIPTFLRHLRLQKQCFNIHQLSIQTRITRPPNRQ